jgi:hypothetical protein
MSDLLPVQEPEPADEARETELWQVLDWSLWGNGLADVLRFPMADVMVAALTDEQREQAEACIKAWHERRGPSMAVGEGTELQRQRDLLAWLHAEARWERDQALLEIDRANNAWREIVDQWERGHDNDVLPYTAQLEGEIAALKAEAAEAPEPEVEYGQQMSGGGFHVRVTGPDYERYYPLEQWIEHKVAEGNCWRRRVVVVEDWTEVTEQ